MVAGYARNTADVRRPLVAYVMLPLHGPFDLGVRLLVPSPRVGGVNSRRIGGGGGNRTRVRKSSTVSSTCLAWSFDLTAHPPAGKLVLGELPGDLAASEVTPRDAISCE